MNLDVSQWSNLASVDVVEAENMAWKKGKFDDSTIKHLWMALDFVIFTENWEILKIFELFLFKNIYSMWYWVSRHHMLYMLLTEMISQVRDSTPPCRPWGNSVPAGLQQTGLGCFYTYQDRYCVTVILVFSCMMIFWKKTGRITATKRHSSILLWYVLFITKKHSSLKFIFFLLHLSKSDMNQYSAFLFKVGKTKYWNSGRVIP